MHVSRRSAPPASKTSFSPRSHMSCVPRLTPSSAGRRFCERRQPPSAEDLQRGTEAIERNARAQVQLIEDLLDLSRIMSGTHSLDVQRLVLSDVVESAMQSMEPRHNSRAYGCKSCWIPLPDGSRVIRLDCSRSCGICSAMRSSSRPRAAECKSRWRGWTLTWS